MKKVDLKKIIKGKTAVFIDSANIYYSQQSLGWRLDYEKLYYLFTDNTQLTQINYYTGKIGRLEKQLSFLDKLKAIGYQIITKEVKLIKLSDGNFIHKGNLDVELALDAYRLSKSYETIVLISGDSDFAYLLDLLKEKGKKRIVISTNKHISIELLERAKYIDLKNLRSKLEWQYK